MGGKIKRGQVTIFILLGILIVVGIVFMFSFKDGITNLFREDLDINSEIQQCIEEGVTQEINNILETGGKPESNLKINNLGVNYTYVCYQKSNYLTCVNLNPAPISSAESLLKKKTEEKTKECFSRALDKMSDEGYKIEEKELKYSIALVPSSILISIKKPLSFSKEESTKVFEDFSFEVKSKLYDILNLVREIINQESQYCYFDYVGLMALYPEFKITRTNIDGSRLYTIKNKLTNEEIKFAVRGCAIPQGI